MPDSTITRRPARPTEGFTTVRLRGHRDRPARLFVPVDHQPKYPYPLVVLFHAEGADEDAACRLVPLLSRRNYIVACPRGPVALDRKAAGQVGYGWGPGTPDAYLRQLLAHAHTGHNVNPQRVYLVGVGAGANAAFRLALAHPAAGVGALNGVLPARTPAAPRGTRVFVGCGASNPGVSVSAARRSSRQLSGLGADVRLQVYTGTQGSETDMLRDVNRWIMTAVNTTPELFPNAKG